MSQIQDYTRRLIKMKGASIQAFSSFALQTAPLLPLLITLHQCETKMFSLKTNISLLLFECQQFKKQFQNKSF